MSPAYGYRYTRGFFIKHNTSIFLFFPLLILNKIENKKSRSAVCTELAYIVLTGGRWKAESGTSFKIILHSIRFTVHLFSKFNIRKNVETIENFPLSRCFVRTIRTNSRNRWLLTHGKVEKRLSLGTSRKLVRFSPLLFQFLLFLFHCFLNYSRTKYIRPRKARRRRKILSIEARRIQFVVLAYANVKYQKKKEKKKKRIKHRNLTTQSKYTYCRFVLVLFVHAPSPLFPSQSRLTLSQQTKNFFFSCRCTYCTLHQIHRVA